MTVEIVPVGREPIVAEHGVADPVEVRMPFDEAVQRGPNTAGHVGRRRHLEAPEQPRRLTQYHRIGVRPAYISPESQVHLHGPLTAPVYPLNTAS